MDRIIYHYCSMDTFNLIMRNKTIRLSDITKSNDSKEKILIYDHLKDAIDLAFSEIHLPISAIDHIGCDYFSEYSYLEYFRKEIESAINHSSLVACFSRNGDLLSQWRGYANDGCGFAIGFNRTLLEQCLRRDDRFFVSGIEYDTTRQIKMIDNDVKESFLDVVEWNGLDLDFPKHLDIFNDEIDDIAYELGERLNLTSCLMKKKTFQEEDEVRIVFSPDIDPEYGEDTVLDQKISGTTKLSLLKPDYITRGNQFVLHVDMDIKKALADGLIKEIIIGPKVNMTIEEVYTYLYIREFPDIEVKKSEISYR